MGRKEGESIFPGLRRPPKGEVNLEDGYARELSRIIERDRQETSPLPGKNRIPREIRFR